MICSFLSQMSNLWHDFNLLKMLKFIYHFFVFITIETIFFFSVKACLHGTIAAATLTQQMGCTGFNASCSDGAIATILIYPTQPIGCDK